MTNSHDYVDSDSNAAEDDQAGATYLPSAMTQEGTLAWALRRYLLTHQNPRTAYQYDNGVRVFLEQQTTPLLLADLRYDHLSAYRAWVVSRTQRGRASRVTPAANASSIDRTTSAAQTTALVPGATKRRGRPRGNGANGPLATGSAANLLKEAKVFLKWAHSEGMLPQLDGLRLVSCLKPIKVVRVKQSQALPEEDFANFVNAAALPSRHYKRRWFKRPADEPEPRTGAEAATGARTWRRDRALVIFKHLTGVRSQEICNIDIGDLRRVHGEDGQMEWWLDLPAHKTKGGYGERKEPIDAGMIAILDDMLQHEGRSLADRQQPLFRSEHVGPEGQHRLGPHQIDVIYQRAVRQWVKHFGGDPTLRLSPHSARRSFVTWMGRGNPAVNRAPVSLDDLRRLVGHMDITTTQEYFVEGDARRELRGHMIVPPPEVTAAPMPEQPTRTSQKDNG